MALTTFDKFLGGQLIIEQPKVGYRAATDPVLLAASIPAHAGQSVLDVGCGVGTASLCLANRVPDLSLNGLEMQIDYSDLARKNALAAGHSVDVVVGDLAHPPIGIKGQVYDHVMSNPPFYRAETSSSIITSKALADQETMMLSVWIKQCLKRVKPKGYFTVIHLAERLPDILSATQKCGEVVILPITGRKGRAAKRVLVRVRTNSKTPAKLLTPFIMHEGASHEQDGKSFTNEAQKILEFGKALRI